MPSLRIDNAAQLRLIWGFNGQAAFNVIGVLVTGTIPFDQGMANRLGTAIKSGFATSLGPHLATTTVLEKVGIRDIRNGGLPEFIDGGVGTAGTGVGDRLPNQTALVMTLRTANATRSGRGRIYWGGFTETENVTGGTATQAAADGAISFISFISTALVQEGLQLAVLQRPANQVTLTRDELLPDGTHRITTRVHAARPGIARMATTSEVRDLAWDTQRRRNNGRGALVLQSLLATNRVALPR